jgi:hypothetical protein
LRRRARRRGCCEDRYDVRYRIGRSTEDHPAEWTLAVLFAVTTALMYWYNMPLLLQLVNVVGLTGLGASYLWRHYVGGEPQRRFCCIFAPSH